VTKAALPQIKLQDMQSECGFANSHRVSQDGDETTSHHRFDVAGEATLIGEWLMGQANLNSPGHWLR